MTTITVIDHGMSLSVLYIGHAESAEPSL
jgi:hypothetical protein